MKNNKKTAFTVIELSVVLLVIALVVGMALGTNHILTIAKLTNLRSISSKSPIYDITENTFWFDVAAKDAFTSYPQNDDSISSLYDVSPHLENNINLTQATGSAQPTFIYDSVDGLPSLSFDGGDSLADTQTRSISDFSGINQGTMIFVVKYISGAPLNFNFRDASNNRFSSHAVWGGNIYFDFGICCSAPNRVYVAAPSGFSNNWRILTLVKYTGSGIIRVNGTTLTTNASMNGSHTIPSTDNISIGEGFNGQMREILTFKRALTDDEIDDIERYLSNKWQIDLD